MHEIKIFLQNYLSSAHPYPSIAVYTDFVVDLRYAHSIHGAEGASGLDHSTSEAPPTSTDSRRPFQAVLSRLYTLPHLPPLYGLEFWMERLTTYCLAANLPMKMSEDSRSLKRQKVSEDRSSSTTATKEQNQTRSGSLSNWYDEHKNPHTSPHSPSVSKVTRNSMSSSSFDLVYLNAPHSPPFSSLSLCCSLMAMWEAPLRNVDLFERQLSPGARCSI